MFAPGASIHFASTLFILLVGKMMLLLHMSKHTILSNNKLCIMDTYILFTYMTRYVLVVCPGKAFIVLPALYDTSIIGCMHCVQ